MKQLGWLLCFTVLSYAGEKPENALRKLMLNSFPQLETAHVGYKVVDLGTGETIASNNDSSFFSPASNAKLYTTAAALNLLGPNYTFTTELRTSGAWSAGTNTIADLDLVGGGDPELSGRIVPYSLTAPENDPLGPLRTLAAQLKLAGVQHISGNVTGVATRYDSELHPDDWTLDDTLYDYGAPVSALTVDDNTVSVLLHPTAPGELAQIELHPDLPYFVVLNNVLTVPNGKTELNLTRPPGSNELLLWGTIAMNVPELTADVAVNDPALFASEALVAVLCDAGIVVGGEPRAKYCSPLANMPSSNGCENVGGTVLATHQSPPLQQIVQVVDKVSQNLHAEMLLQEMEHVTGKSDAREQFLNSLGISFKAADGSGLARGDLATPGGTIALLEAMWSGPNHDAWLASLPIGGVDGTLQHRFRNLQGSERIHAKTGSLSHVNALSGYIETRAHTWLAFSAMVDQTTVPDRESRAFLDALCEVLLQQ